ncbi:hypothetical protein J3R30DRAFT_2952175 [Lentinula aciculospora]|uniref:Uncharacterized protein n=1 Tax=Lentinula aciculospora TaxID=153920 RepID=A0A9W8ZRY6_9AGAR|nr:hypothetical protein J3R30DRAFT_2952175 [Lentinula aciculospora]
MAQSSMFVFDANPHAASIRTISHAEESLALQLFANFDKAWNHPALQDRLRRARNQTNDAPSTLNSMTLFSVIWSSCKPPEFQTYQIVWKAMRMQLENSGVLARLVSEFNACVTRKAKAHWRETGKSGAESQVNPGVPQPLGHSISRAWQEVGRRKVQRRTRVAKKSSVVSSSYPAIPQSDDRGVESKFFVRERPSPAPTLSGSTPNHPSLYSSVPYPEFSSTHDLYFDEEEETNNQERFNSDSSYPPSNSYSHSFRSFNPGTTPVSTQQTYLMAGQQQMLGPAFTSNANPYADLGYGHERLQQPLADFSSFSPYSTNSFPEVYPQTPSSAANFGLVASGPSNITSSDYATQIPQQNSYSTQAYHITSAPFSQSQTNDSSLSRSFVGSTSSYNSAFISPQANYLRANLDMDFGGEHEFDGVAYEGMQSEQGSGYSGMYDGMNMQPEMTNHNFGNDYEAVTDRNWTVNKNAARVYGDFHASSSERPTSSYRDGY